MKNAVISPAERSIVDTVALPEGLTEVTLPPRFARVGFVQSETHMRMWVCLCDAPIVIEQPSLSDPSYVIRRALRTGDSVQVFAGQQFRLENPTDKPVKLIVQKG